MFEDPIQNAAGIFENLVIPETNNPKSFPFKTFGASLVFELLDCMLTSVKFHNQLSFQTAEIGDIRSDRLLSPEFISEKLPGTKQPPQSLFRFCLIASQSASNGF